MLLLQWNKNTFSVFSANCKRDDPPRNYKISFQSTEDDHLNALTERVREYVWLREQKLTCNRPRPMEHAVYKHHGRGYCCCYMAAAGRLHVLYAEADSEALL